MKIKIVKPSNISFFFYFRDTFEHLEYRGGSDGKESACNAGDLSSIPGLGRSPGEGDGNPLPYSCLENPMDRGAWRATAHRVPKSQTMTKRLTFSQFEHLIDAYILKVMSLMSIP